MKNKSVRILVFLLLAVAIAVAVVYRDHLDASSLQAFVQDAGAWGPLLFMLVYVLATVLFLPGSVLTLAGGALFGPVMGTFYNLTGATVGALLAFLISRYLASDWVEKKTGGRLKQLVSGVESEGWRFVAFVRLVPVFPFNVLNYALGLTKIPIVHYALASYVCMLPGTIAYTWLGYAAKQAVGGDAEPTQLIQTISIAVALVAMVAFLPRFIRRFRTEPLTKESD